MEINKIKKQVKIEDDGSCCCLLGLPLVLLLLGGAILLTKLAWSFLLYAINY